MKFTFTLLFSLLTFIGFTQEWESIASLPDNFNTDHSFAFSIGEVGYIVAGNTPSGYSSSFYSYNPETDEWTRKDDFPGGARGFAIGEVWNGKAYFGFGNGAGGNRDDFWEYDPVTDEWKQLASCDCPARTHPAMVALNGEIYLGLGGTNNGNANDWWVYDIENNTWEERTRFPAAERHHPYQFTDGEYVYVGFGHGNGFISNQWYRYNTLDDSWLEMQTLPAEGRVAGTQLSYKGVGLILSGDGDDHGVMETGEFWMYEPLFDKWSTLPPHPGSSRWAPASFIINDEVYFLNGERSGFYYTDNYKLDLSFLNTPILSLSTDKINSEFDFTEDKCNASLITKVTAGTRVPFDIDVNVMIEVDPSSTAVEGDDFIIETNDATLLAGDNMIDFEIIILDNSIVDGDKVLKLNLVTDQETGVDNVSIDLIEDDIEFGTESVTRLIKVGEGDAGTIAPFARYYENARSQMLYRSDMLKSAGVGAGDINKIAFDVTSAAGQSFANFTVNIAHTSLQQFNGTFTSGLAFEEVFRGTYNSVNGINDIEFETPFTYDGESNIVIQICFDNGDWTTDDNAAATDVGYNSTIVVQADGVNGCPNAGEVTSTSELPNLIVYKDGFYPLYVDVNNRFQSDINENESIYFSTNDSIYAIIDNIGAVESACFSSQLISNSNLLMGNDISNWIDRVYQISNEGMSPDDYEVTIIMPNIADFDFNSDDLVGMYSVNSTIDQENPDWQFVDIISTEVNEEYVTVKIRYQGDGYYTVGSSLISNTNEQSFDILYDNITIYDAMGRIVFSGKNEISIDNLPQGVYFKTYTNKGLIVKSIKVMP